MRIIRVGKREIKRFVDCPDRLYRNDPRYVPYMKSDLKKTLKRLLLRDKTYFALLALDDTGQAVGRVLVTISENKQLHTDKCGFFSLYECIDDDATSDALLFAMTEELKRRGAEYVSGTYFPYDPDNRRGILQTGFERAPLIFTSYNPPYYNDQLERFGMKKQVDAYQYVLDPTFKRETFARLAAHAMKTFDFRVDHLDRRHCDRDVRDFHAVIEQATTELNYQEAPSLGEITKVFRSWKRFFIDDLVLIARRNEDDKPIGIALAIPDYFQAFRKAGGKSNPVALLKLLAERKRIRSARAMLQYAVPEYQSRGVYIAGYSAMQDALIRHGMDYVEAGTIMEHNRASTSVIESTGGKLARVYRIYYMDLREGTSC